MDFIEHITWTEYITNVIIVAVLYYITVILLYFRKDFPKYLPKQLQAKPTGVSFTAEIAEQHIEDQDIFILASKASAAIRKHTRDGSNRAQTQKELLFSIHLILQQFKILRYTPFEQAINNLIATEADDHFSFNLEDEELNSVWVG